MASHWFNLLMGAALIQGILTLSPIPDMESLDDEWVQFNQRLDDVNYRLPLTTQPKHYEVLLIPYLDKVPTTPAGIQPFTFEGEVKITITATQAGVNRIVLHCNDLTIRTLTVTSSNTTGGAVDLATPDQSFVCDPTTSFLTVNTTEPLPVNQDFIISSTFSGNLQTNMRGFYRSWYRDSSNETRIVNGRITEQFFTTPKTSTYLLAFIVSHYTSKNNNDTERPFSIHARNNIGNNGDWSLDVGQRLLKEMENYTGIPYYKMASQMTLQQAAIPDFSAGAMENWGLLTYREALILYDPVNSNHFYKQRVANIVAHEIAHMWFGNLVTCAWWDNLWLNEGFARFYQYYLTELVEPTFGYDSRFIVEQVHTAMFSDSTDNAHPLTDPTVGSPASVSRHFSTITYARGAAVLRMTQYLLGKDTFKKALNKYLKQREFNVAEPNHLFAAFDDAAKEDNALTAYSGLTIAEYFKTWSEQAGHPLVTVSVNQETGLMTVKQDRWERNTGNSTKSTLYQIPLTWTQEDNADFLNLKPSQILSKKEDTISRNSTGLKWVVFNKQQSGFYRVNYDDTNWILLTRALRAKKDVIHEHNRAQIVDDLFVFARAKVTTYDRALNILSYLQFEDDYAPWLAAISGFNFAIRRLAHNDAQQQELNGCGHAHSAHNGGSAPGFSEVSGDSFMTSLQRMYVMSFLCDVGHEACIAAAKTNFATWKAGGSVPANMRPWVYCTGLRVGNRSDFEFFWDKYLKEDLAGEQVVLINAAGCTNDTASLHQFWDAITDDKKTIRAQDYSAALSSAITSNEENTMRSFEWLKANLERTRESVGLETPINSIFSRLLNEEQIAEVSAWLEQNKAVLTDPIYNTGVNAIATSRNNIAWYQERVPEFTQFFETGYLEQKIDGEEDNKGNGNIATLSIATLIVTLAVNFLS